MSERDEIADEVLVSVGLGSAKGREQDRPLPMALIRGSPCPHMMYGTTVHEEDRTVTCNHCKRTVDPFEVVIWIARDWNRLAWIRDEKRALEAEVEKLHRERRNLRAQVRRAAKGPRP